MVPVRGGTWGWGAASAGASWLGTGTPCVASQPRSPLSEMVERDKPACMVAAKELSVCESVPRTSVRCCPACASPLAMAAESWGRTTQAAVAVAPSSFASLVHIIWGCNFSLLKGDFLSLEVSKLLALLHQVFCLGDSSRSCPCLAGDGRSPMQ